MNARAGDPSRAKKDRMLRRTAVGLLLAALAIGLLVLAHGSETGWIVLAPALALSALGCFELSRMGSFAGNGWGWVLAPCWLASVLVGYSTLDLEFGPHLHHDDLMADGYAVVLSLELVSVGLLALIARASVDLLRTRRAIASTAALLLVAWTATWGFFCLSPMRPSAPIPLADSYLGLWGLAKMLAPAAIVAWYASIVGSRQCMPALVMSLWLVPLLVLPLPWLWHAWQRFGPGALVALIVLSKIGDTAGYFVGSAIGKRHPFPRISPGKTVEGCLASFAAGTLAGGILVATGNLPDGPLGLFGGLLAGAVTNLAAQAGDLVESWIKRRAGVKDSSGWLGPAGGVLDVVDSLLLSVPVALLAWPWLFS